MIICSKYILRLCRSVVSIMRIFTHIQLLISGSFVILNFSFKRLKVGLFVFNMHQKCGFFPLCISASVLHIAG